MTTWKKEIDCNLNKNNETWDDVISCTLSEKELNKKFDSSYGLPEGKPFTVWTTNNVYFPVCYDGAEWCCSVSRNPDGKPTSHKGGG